MAAASFALLKGQAKAAQAATPEAEEDTQTAEVAAAVEEQALAEVAPVGEEADTVEVDVDTMTGPQLDELVKEHNLPVPTSWWKQENGVKKLTVPEKKAWLNAYDPDAQPTVEEGKAFDEALADAPITKVEGENPDMAAPESAVAAEVPAGKTKPSKAVAKTKAALNGEVVGDDALADVVYDIENLSEDAARKLVSTLAETADLTYFKMGGVLARIQANGWFTPYASFREFVEAEHGLHYRKAMYWIAIYNDLTEAHIPWAKVSHLGWSKLKEIAGILTAENLEEWVKIAEGNSTLQLVEIVSAAKKKAVGTALSSPDVADTVAVSTKTFKCHTDQKATIDAALEKARAEAQTTFDTVALEFICLDYLGAAPKPIPLAQALKSTDLDTALAAFADAFPDVSLKAEVP